MMPKSKLFRSCIVLSNLMFMVIEITSLRYIPTDCPLWVIGVLLFMLCHAWEAHVRNIIKTVRIPHDRLTPSPDRS